MLEGQMVHLPAPKTHYAKDIVYDKDTPIFCTGKQPFVYSYFKKLCQKKIKKLISQDCKVIWEFLKLAYIAGTM